MSVDRPKVSVPQVRAPRIEEMIDRIIGLKVDAERLDLDGLAYFLEICLTEARVQASRALGETGDV